MTRSSRFSGNRSHFPPILICLEGSASWDRATILDNCSIFLGGGHGSTLTHPTRRGASKISFCVPPCPQLEPTNEMTVLVFFLCVEQNKVAHRVRFHAMYCLSVLAASRWRMDTGGITVVPCASSTPSSSTSRDRDCCLWLLLS